MIQEIERSRMGFCWAEDAFQDIPTVKAWFDSLKQPNRAESPTQTRQLDPQNELAQVQTPREPNAVDIHNELPQEDTRAELAQAGVRQETPQANPPSPTLSKWAMPPSVIEELQKDVQGAMHDSLGGVTPWWFLEFIPLWKHFLDKDKQQWKELK